MSNSLTANSRFQFGISGGLWWVLLAQHGSLNAFLKLSLNLNAGLFVGLLMTVKDETNSRPVCIAARLRNLATNLPIQSIFSTHILFYLDSLRDLLSSIETYKMKMLVCAFPNVSLPQTVELGAFFFLFAFYHFSLYLIHKIPIYFIIDLIYLFFCQFHSKHGACPHRHISNQPVTVLANQRVPRQTRVIQNLLGCLLQAR